MKKVLVLKTNAMLDCYQDHIDFEALELRLDLIEDWDFTLLKEIINFADRPIILTLRTVAEGGEFVGDYKSLVFQLASLGADYLDVELRSGLDFILDLKKNYPDLQIIVSQHLPDTPEDLSNLPIITGFLNKIVTTACSTIDALNVMHFIKGKSGLVMHAMGEFGIVTRIYAAMQQQPLIYIGGDDSITNSDFFYLYRVQRLGFGTKIFGLIGSPICHSLGRQYYNARLGESAVYVNLPLTIKELPRFFALLPGLPFFGFSVTSPLKSDISKFITTNLLSVNTLIKHKCHWRCYNTDGIGAFRALGDIEGKVLVLGAGGSAIAITNYLQQAKKPYVVLNRTLGKAKLLGQAAYDFDTFLGVSHGTYAAVINATPNTQDSVEKFSDLLRPYVNANTKYLSLDYRNPSTLKLPVINISPELMFYEQAAEQLLLFNDCVII